MKLVDQFQNFIRRHRLLAYADTVIIGVSAGADSVCLTHLMRAIKMEWGLHLILAHFNHHLRIDSGGDERYVAKLSQRLGIPYVVGHWDRSKETRPGSLEEKAREARINFFTRLSQKHKAQAIALAHTQNELSETVLLRILRGTGLQGMRGILPKTSLAGFVFIRPLLEIKREMIEEYLKKEGVPWREDKTNRETIFLRNKIRLHLLPLLKQYNPNITLSLARLAQNSALDYDYLRKSAEKVFKKIVRISRSKKSVTINLSNLQKEHPALKRLVIRLCVEKIKGDTNSLTLTHALEIEDLIRERPEGSQVNLPSGLTVEKDAKNLVIMTAVRRD